MFESIVEAVMSDVNAAIGGGLVLFGLVFAVVMAKKAFVNAAMEDAANGPVTGYYDGDTLVDEGDFETRGEFEDAYDAWSEGLEDGGIDDGIDGGHIDDDLDIDFSDPDMYESEIDAAAQIKMEFPFGKYSCEDPEEFERYNELRKEAGFAD